MNKLGIAIGGLLMAGALMAPVTFAHTDSGNAARDLAIGDAIPTITDDLYKTPDVDQPSGWYYSASSLIVGICDPQPPLAAPDCTPDGDDHDIPGDPGSNCGALGDPDAIEACEAATSPLGPGFRFTSISGVVADAEVGGLGTCNDPVLDLTNTQNEDTVDGTPGQGSVPDGLWNDGGIGFVSHTDHYDCASAGPNADGIGADGENWNTLGCNRYADAVAEDAISGRDVWLFTTCSWGTPTVQGGEGLDAVLLQFLGNIPNNVLGGLSGGQSLLDNVQYLDDCGLGDNIDNDDTGSGPSVCDGATTTIVCGAGTVSSDEFGDGHGTDIPSAGFNDPNLPDCDDFATASVFPISGVILTYDPSADVPLSVVDSSIASVGYVA